MRKIMMIMMISLSVQGFTLEKYSLQLTSTQCEYLKNDSIKYAIKAKHMNAVEKAKQYKDLADNLYEQNKRCVKGKTQRIYGSPAQFK